jgi:hypothetical protein
MSNLDHFGKAVGFYSILENLQVLKSSISRQSQTSRIAFVAAANYGALTGARCSTMRR